MPLLPSSFHAPPYLRNPHAQTILGAFQRAPALAYRRERIDTADGDFLDLDWAGPGVTPERPLAILSFGMEGDSQRPYVRAVAHALVEAGWAALVWHYRSTSGEPNRKLHFYHSGLVEDLECVMRHAASLGARDIDLVGFSLGGNLTLNLLGRRGAKLKPAVRRAVVFSVPCDVMDCATQLRRGENDLYMRRFLASFRDKIRRKMPHFEGLLSDRGFETIRSLEEYDERYTVPHFRFSSVAEFYRAVSSRFVLGAIRVPTLLINAKDDPFLGPRCFPTDVARASDILHLETPAHGGHLAFLRGPFVKRNWMADRTLAFLRGDSD